ncbi:hypothetical protein CDAR_15231 [Caerostris darwini]|uniref:Transposase n=1 Tax=Caerostris darwini TaxID=1538125 RepID=A0AAV4QIQ8_9ARAC|nr:hypothetical protein CDAR_15231 [Caerostris darwini]
MPFLFVARIRYPIYMLSKSSELMKKKLLANRKYQKYVVIVRVILVVCRAIRLLKLKWRNSVDRLTEEFRPCYEKTESWLLNNWHGLKTSLVYLDETP